MEISKIKENMHKESEYMALSELYKLFGDPTRIKLMHALSMGEMCVCDIAQTLSITKSAVSHQLKTLRLSNLVKFRREGKHIFYSLADDHVKKIIDMGIEHVNE